MSSLTGAALSPTTWLEISASEWELRKSSGVGVGNRSWGEEAERVEKEFDMATKVRESWDSEELVGG